MSLLNAFKLKEFDLEPIFLDWNSAPIFTGNPKKDLPVDDWLEQIREGCVARGVPEEYWYKVAQHFMGPKARARLDELKQVIVKVHGAKYRWTWKKFKIAMQSMGWTIDKDAKETIKVTGKSSGLWFSRKKDSEPNDREESAPSRSSTSSSSSIPTRPPPTRSNTIFSFTKKPIVDEPEGEEEELVVVERPRRGLARARSNTTSVASTTTTTSGFWPSRMSTASKDDKDLPGPSGHQKSRSDSVVRNVGPKSKSRSPARSQTGAEGNEVATVAQAPVWLLNACTALEFITSEHPKAMSILSAILITAGSIPAIPAIAAGAGGTVLASGAAHAVGAIAVGLGQALGTTVKKSQQTQEAQASSISR